MKPKSQNQHTKPGLPRVFFRYLSALFLNDAFRQAQRVRPMGRVCAGGRWSTREPRRGCAQARPVCRWVVHRLAWVNVNLCLLVLKHLQVENKSTVGKQS